MLQFDPMMDLAIIKIDPDHSLAAIKVGTSSDLMVGETVITIGNAYGYENTVSVGIVSAYTGMSRSPMTRSIATWSRPTPASIRGTRGGR